MISLYHKETDGFTTEVVGKNVRFGFCFDGIELGWYYVSKDEADCGTIDSDALNVILNLEREQDEDA